MDEKEITQLAKVMDAGFKELGARIQDISKDVNDIKIGRAEEKGFEMKQKVSNNAEAIAHLNEWKIEVDPMLKNLRRAVWGIASAVGAAFLTGFVALIIYGITHFK